MQAEEDETGSRHDLYKIYGTALGIFRHGSKVYVQKGHIYEVVSGWIALPFAMAVLSFPIPFPRPETCWTAPENGPEAAAAESPLPIPSARTLARKKSVDFEGTHLAS